MIKRASIAIAFIFALAGCAASTSWISVPKQLVDVAGVSGYTNIRFWGDQAPQNLDAIIAKKIDQTNRRFAATGRPQSINLLAVSGGGSDGAFGAGLLVGWSEAGNRPEFEVVTGISAGALIAPLVFLGPEYDPSLKNVFTTISTKDVLRVRGLGGLLGGTALADSDPLLQTIGKYVDDDFLRKVAREHSRGRRLYIGTTNLEAKRSVIWDMGEIADSDAPDKVDLFRSILLASASIPGAFPPVKIAVTANGESYDEVHADGGTTNQLFLYPTRINLSNVSYGSGFTPRRRMFIIRNGKLTSEWESIKPKSLAIAGRAISILIESQGNGDIIKQYGISQRDNIDFNLASIPQDFILEAKEPFDPSRMQALFKLAYEEARNGYNWKKRPPQFR